MTDTVLRQDVIDAIAGERLNEDTGSEGDAAYERALDDVLEAINAIPAVTVTDDVVQRAVHAYQGHCGDLVFEDSMKAALVAALGE